MAILTTPPAHAQQSPPVLHVGSKADTETVVLADLAALLLRDADLGVVHHRRMGGTPVLWAALKAGELDAYPEYTGTISGEIFKGRGLTDEAAIRAALAEVGVGMTRPLGFANNYAIGMRAERARELGVAKISDLAADRHKNLTFGFSGEFLARPDGWPGLRQRYGLPQKAPRGMDHQLAYQGLIKGSLDATDIYTTDAEIRRFDLVALEDDRGFFPVYSAVYVYRLDSAARTPGLRTALERVEGRIREPEIIEMNARAQAGEPEDRIAADFLRDRLQVIAEVTPPESELRRVLRLTAEHLKLAGVSLLAAVLIAVPLGVVAAARPKLGQGLLAAAGLIQTVPSFALLVLMIPLLGTGFWPAVVALFLYSLLPILRNTVTGLRDIPPSLREAAEGLGLSPWARLTQVELPMASRAILAGIKTSAVINVGTATLGAFIGAGGLGELIRDGIFLHSNRLLLLGAVPAALLALAVQGVFELAERGLVPKGLRLGPTR